MSKSESAARGSYVEFRDNWRLLLATTAGVSVGFPTLALFSIGIFAPIMAEEFTWSFASIMGGLMLASLVILFLGPVIGHLIDKHGPRMIAAVSLAGFGLSYMSLALSSGSIVQYYASWAAMSLTGIGATAISFTHAVNSKFVIRRGLALGITLAGSGLVALWVKPFGAWAIDAFGWRATIAMIGAFPIVLGVPLVLWGFPRQGATAPKSDTNAHGAGGLTLKQALGKPAFWILIGAFVPISFANGAPLPNMENILHSLDLNAAQVVQLASLIGASLIVGRVLGGWLVDRFWAPLVALVLLISAAAGCWLLTLSEVSYAQALTSVVLLSVAAGVEYDLLSYMVARYLGRRHYGAIYSVVFGLFAIGAGGGPALLGHAFDSAGNYDQGLLICGAALLFAGVLLLTLGRYPNFDDETPASAARAE